MAAERGPLEALEAALDPRQPLADGWSVYADALCERGSVLGERLALGLAQARAESVAQRSALEREIASFERRHAKALWGPRWLEAERAPDFAERLSIVRVHGQIVEAHIYCRSARPYEEVEVLLNLLNQTPIARALQVLGLHRRCSVSVAAGLAIAMSRAAEFQSLRGLVVDNHREPTANPSARLSGLGLPERPSSIDRMDIRALLEAWPKLRWLSIAGIEHTRRLESASLEELEIVGCRVRDSLGSMRLSALRSLHYGGYTTTPFWTTARLGQLRSLSLQIYDRANRQRVGGFEQFIDFVLAEPLPESVRELGLANSQLQGPAVRRLVRERAHFQRFDRLDLSRNRIDRMSVDLLRWALPRVEIGEQFPEA